jgi:hypothetical protein
MDEEIKKIIKKDRPKLKDNTIEGYARRIRIIYQEYGDDKTLIEYFSDKETVIKNVEEKYKKNTTFSAVIMSIIIYLKAVKASDKLVDYYAEKFIKVKNEINELNICNKKSDKEKENWITQAELKEKIDQLKSSLADEKNIFDIFQQYMVLNLYFLIMPLRNDYARVKVFSKFNSSCPGNQIALDKKQLILNEYKTFKFYGEKNIDLPDELVDIISEWIVIREKIHPELKDRKELLFNLKLTPMNQVNLTMYLNKIFGKKISSSMLRKSFLSEKFPVNETYQEMEQIAQSMCHSIKEQQTTYRKK